MNQFKKAQVIILPTNTISKLALCYDEIKDNGDKRLQQSLMQQPHINNGMGMFITGWVKPIYQYLYIVENRLIKDGEYFIDYINNKVFQWNMGEGIHKNKSTYCNVIIATTDTSLNLPQPSQQFIEKYIEEYNKGNVIKDVLVEYTCNTCNLTRNVHNGMFEVDCNNCNYKKGNEYPDLKVNPKDNTITIKKLKDSWNREELINILSQLKKDVINKNNAQITNLDLNEWIKENL